ncbi:orotate phosphoribosyltransferase [Candidatus Roizmanbacteria bacterium]|nr:orotate phosphoribosyltransferase [Candidatus Roizmanbacteria bacterium]
MSMFDSKLKERLIIELHEVRIIDFGLFKLKSGLMSPYYIDLRLLVTFPHLLELVSDVLWQKIRLKPFDLIAGIPYAALPIATSISLRYNRPMIFVRKEKKEYGKGKQIEGIYHEGQHVVVIDDVISDGASKFEIIKPIEDEKLKVSQVVVLLDRNQGGPKTLIEKGYHCETITSMDEVLNILYQHNRITQEQLMDCRIFMAQSSKLVTQNTPQNPPRQKRSVTA